jgi:hypothetical protein
LEPDTCCGVIGPQSRSDSLSHREVQARTIGFVGRKPTKNFPPAARIADRHHGVQIPVAVWLRTYEPYCRSGDLCRDARVILRDRAVVRGLHPDHQGLNSTWFAASPTMESLDIARPRDAHQHEALSDRLLRELGAPAHSRRRWSGGASHAWSPCTPTSQCSRPFQVFLRRQSGSLSTTKSACSIRPRASSIAVSTARSRPYGKPYREILGIATEESADVTSWGCAARMCSI